MEVLAYPTSQQSLKGLLTLVWEDVEDKEFAVDLVSTVEESHVNQGGQESIVFYIQMKMDHGDSMVIMLLRRLLGGFN